MTESNSILRTAQHDPHLRMFWCPGCNCAHYFNEGWTFDGNEETPTVSPSILVRGEGICHLFIRSGKLVFLSDCTHHLAGQTVAMEPF